MLQHSLKTAEITLFSVVQENAATWFCCEALEKTFCILTKLQLSVQMVVEREDFKQEIRNNMTSF